MQCTSALLCLNDCGKSHMFIDSFVHHHFRDSFFLYSLPASFTWTFRGSLGLFDLPSIDVQHLGHKWKSVLEVLAYWKIMENWQVNSPSKHHPVWQNRISGKPELCQDSERACWNEIAGTQRAQEVAKFCRDGEACVSPERACAFGCSQWSQAFASLMQF